MLYREIVKDSVSYRAIRRLTVSLAESYPGSVTGGIIRLCKEGAVDIFNKSDSSRLFRSMHNAMSLNFGTSADRAKKSVLKKIGSILSNSMIVKILKIKI